MDAIDATGRFSPCGDLADFKPERLHSGEAHVWCVLGRQGPPAPVMAAILDDDEHSRAARLVQERDRYRFIISHAVLRLILAGYMALPPQSLCFGATERRKPYLIDAYGLVFNLSHSADAVVVAVSRSCALGVDVEQLRLMSERDRLVERFYSPVERAAWGGVPESERDEVFFHLWTRKEAWLKALGEGLWRSLDSFSVGIETPARMIDPPVGWSLHHLAPAPGYVGALAVDQVSLRLGGGTLVM